MMQRALGLINYGLILIFGVVLSLLFSGVEQRRKPGVQLFFTLLLLVLQILCWRSFGLETTQKVYPLLVHFPLVLFLILYYKVAWLKALVSVLSAYLCCQIPRWISGVAFFIFGSLTARYIAYILAVLPVLFLLKRYVAPPVSRLMDVSRRSLLFFGAVPLLYYLFDYATTVYTDLLYTGARVAVQFLPSVVSTFYFLFALIYYGELQKRAKAERESALLSLQASQAKRELTAYRQAAEQAAVYRHDMRHHLALIDGYLEAGDPAQAAEYIRQAQQDIESITPGRYCLNSTVNLILSSFAAKAETLGVNLSIEAELPKELPFPETDLCTLLANALENALCAASQAEPDKTARVSCQLHKGNLLLYVENSFSGQVIMEEGLPQATREGHGYGVKSMAMIAQKHRGYCAFTAQEGLFTLRVVLPLGGEG